MIVTSMFYTQAERTKRVGYWCKSLVRITYFSSKLQSSSDEWLRHHYSWFHQFWVASHSYTHFFTLAVVSGTYILSFFRISRLLTLPTRLMVITGVITLVTAGLFWLVSCYTITYLYSCLHQGFFSLTRRNRRDSSRRTNVIRRSSAF